MQSISPCLWFNHEAEEAAKFYTSLFKHSEIGRVARYTESSAKAARQKVGDILTIEFSLNGLKFVGLNGGPIFKMTPAVSLFVWCESKPQVDELWKNLSKGGSSLMELKGYPWSEYYGWCQDKYGVSWQLMYESGKGRIAPSLLFMDQLYGKGEEAINFYTSLFEGSKVESMHRDTKLNTIMHSVFKLGTTCFALMEGQSPQSQHITPGISFMIYCKTQDEIDHFWNAFAKSGKPGQCGWIEDKFGVSWQVVPADLADLMTNAAKSESVFKALLQMTKLDLQKLRQAAN